MTIKLFIGLSVSVLLQFTLFLIPYTCDANFSDIRDIHSSFFFQQSGLSKDEIAAIKIADSVIVAQMKNCPHKLTDEQRSLKSYDITVTTLQKNTNSFEVNYKLKQGKKEGPIPAFTVIVNISTRETEFKGMN